MTAYLSRRRFVRGSILGLAAATAPAVAASPLRVPNRPMTLTRQLNRPLSDGKSIVVTRHWSIEFARSSRSLEVIGKQISAKVAAPKRLQAIAAIEEARIIEGMFPIILSDAGMIMVSNNNDQSDAVEQAVNLAKAMIAKARLNAAQRSAATLHLAQMQQASTTLFESLPKDLFFPITAPLRTVRPVKLPDGSHGEFELTYAAKPAPGADWLGSAERQIITRIGSDERRSTEIWSLQE